MEYYAILTEAGLATIANAPVTGLPLRFEKFAVGDGGGEEYAPQASQTALKNTCWEGAVASVRADAENHNIVEVRAVLPSTVGGFVVRELGLLNENGVLVAVANCPPTSKVLLSDGVTSEMEVGMQIAVSGAEHISLTVDPTVILVTQKVLASTMEGHNADPDAHAALIEAHDTDPDAHGGGTVCTLTHTKSGTVHAFTGLGARTGLVPCQFKSTAGYTEGDTATIDGTPYTIVLTGADQPETDLFVSGKSILVDVDTEGKTISFPNAPQDLSGYVTDEEMVSYLNDNQYIRKVLETTVTIPASGWTSCTEGYENIVAVTGMKSDYRPEVWLNLNATDKEIRQAQDEAFGLVANYQAQTNAIRAVCSEDDAPEVDYPLGIQVVIS